MLVNFDTYLSYTMECSFFLFYYFLHIMEKETNPMEKVVLQLIGKMENFSADVVNSLRGTCPNC